MALRMYFNYILGWYMFKHNELILDKIFLYFEVF